MADKKLWTQPANIHPEQDIVYCWRWQGDEIACKIGHSTLGGMYHIKIQSTRYNHLQFELLGVVLCGDKKEARHTERELLSIFRQVNDNSEWVYLTKDVWDWVNYACMKISIHDPKFRDWYNQTRRESYSRNHEYRERHKERMRDPDYNKRRNKRRRERLRQDPEYRERKNRQNREYHNRKKKADQLLEIARRRDV